MIKALQSDYERVKEIEDQLETINNSYVADCIKLYESKGFDSYSPRWQRKMTALAKKYADLISPLKEEHDELRELINEHAENERKQKYEEINDVENSSNSSDD